MKLGSAGSVAVICLLLTCAAAGSTSAGDAGGPLNVRSVRSPGEVVSGAPVRAAQGESRFLGFGLGEERRYVLGPAERLLAGEQAVWSMHLREILADPPDAVFELSHVWERGVHRPARLSTQSGSRGLAIGTVVRVQSAGELRVNPHGFPVELRFETERQLVGLGVESYTVRYRFEDGVYYKHVAAGGRDLEHRVRHFSNDALDLDAAVGMYPFGAGAMECLFILPRETTAYPDPLPGRVTAGGSVPAPLGGRRWAQEIDCKEPLFTNPGLLSLMLPALWEAGTGELEFVALTPAGYFGMPGIGAGGALPGVSVAMLNRAFDSQEASHPRTNTDIEKLTYRDRVRVEVGARTLDAWLFDGMRDFDAVYVDDDGVVLRVDLAARIAADMPTDLRAVQGPTRMDTRELWVRLLFPNEY